MIDCYKIFILFRSILNILLLSCCFFDLIGKIKTCHPIWDTLLFDIWFPKLTTFTNREIFRKVSLLTILSIHCACAKISTLDLPLYGGWTPMVHDIYIYDSAQPVVSKSLRRMSLRAEFTANGVPRLLYKQSNPFL